MELSYKNLKKRDVVNVIDGRCFGHPTDINLMFPTGVMTGIYVPSRRHGLFSFFGRSDIYIDKKNILKIGGDVILVSLKCGDTCDESVNLNVVKKQTSPCKPFDCSPCNCGNCQDDGENNGRIDLTDY